MKVIAGNDLSIDLHETVDFVPPDDPRRQFFAMDGLAARAALVSAVDRVKDAPYWLSCGTALGLVRDGGIIMGDHDIDISLDADWHDPPGDEAMLDLFSGDDYIPLYECRYNGVVYETMFLDVVTRIAVDVLYQYRNFDPGYSWMFAVRASLREPEHLFAERRERETRWGRFVMPHPVEEYLEQHYGPGWWVRQDREGDWWRASCRVPW